MNNLFKNLSIVFSETVVTKALNFLIILILSRQLGPGDYGKYSFVFVAVAFLSAFFDFGMENTAVRFSAREKGKLQIFGLYAVAKIMIMALVAAAILLFGSQVLVLFRKPEITQYLPYLIIGFVGESLFFINDTYLQAIGKFKVRALINICRFTVSLCIAIILLINDAVNLQYVFMLFMLPILISLLFTIKYISFIKSFISTRLSKGLLKEMVDYEKWMLLISIPNNTLSRIDFFMLSIWVAYEQIGIYNAAFQMSAIVSFIPFALGKVMLPALSELSQAEIVEKTKRLTKTTLVISAAMLCLVPLASPVALLLLGEKYAASTSILQVMLISAILTFAIVPIEQAVYSLGKPMFITLGKYIQIVAIVILIFVTVPMWGAIWAAISVAIAKLLYAAILLKLYGNYRIKLLANQMGRGAASGSH